MRTPDWLVDPEGAAVPDDEDEDEAFTPPSVPAARAPLEPLAAARRALARERAEAHTLRVRLSLVARRACRLAARVFPIALATPSAPPRKRGHPGHPVRNDRLLALFEATPAHLPRLTRCHLVAVAYAAECSAHAGAVQRVMPTATVRDAVAEAQRRRERERPDTE